MDIDYNKLKSGDINEFEIFFKLMHHALLLFAIKFVKSKEKANDIVQDIFLKFWNNENKPDSISKAKSYLYTCVRNNCLNHINRTQKTVDLSDDIARVDEQENIDEILIKEEIIRKLYEAIHSLTPQEQKVILLAIKGNKVKDISEILDLSKSTVESYKKRAYKKLRDLLGDDYYAFLLLLGFIS